MYRLTARQILMIAFAAAVMAAVTVLGVQQLSGQWQPFGSASVATPANITDPSPIRKSAHINPLPSVATLV